MNERICSLVILGWEVAVARALNPELVERAVILASGGRIYAVSAEASQEGVCVGMRIRDGQRCCPGAVVKERDVVTALDEFEPFTTGIHDVVHELEIVAPGELAFKADNVLRAYGGEQGLLDHLFAIAPIVPTLASPGSGGARVGAAVAGGRFTAAMAARLAAVRAEVLSSPGPPAGSLVVAMGEEREFLAPLPIEVLTKEAGVPELAETFLLLGIEKVGDLASMPPGAVASRFGRAGQVAHQLALGHDERPLLLGRLDSPLDAACELDPPASTADQLAFAVKSLADRLAVEMERKIVAASSLRLEAIDEAGLLFTASWRNDGGVTSAAERARWHVESWNLSSGIHRLRLIPEDIEPERGRQLRLAGVGGAIDPVVEARAERAVARLQALSDSAETVQIQECGGRLPHERAVLKSVGANGLAESKSRTFRGTGTGEAGLPWPGALPSPAPARAEYVPAATSVAVMDSAALPEKPTRLGDTAISSAAGPFRYRLKWWRESEATQLDLWQVSLEDGKALLVSRDPDGHWRIEAVYD